MAAGKRTRSEGEADSKFSLKSRRTAAMLAVNAANARTKEQIDLAPLRVFRYDFFQDFFKKNPYAPKIQACIDAVVQTAASRWKSLSDADKAPYVARSLVLRKQHIKATSVRASNLADILGNLKV